MGPTSNDKCPYRRQKRERHTWRRVWEDRGRGCREVGTSKVLLEPPEAEGIMMDSPLEPLEGTKPTS